VTDDSVWETDGDGFYDVQYVEGQGPDCRGRLHTRDDGTYDFLAIKPVSYPISNDGPVGALLRALGRHWMRPAHMHFMLMHPEYNKLVTALYTRDDKYVTSDTGILHPNPSNSSFRSQIILDGRLQVDREP
jgi:protocatechuate 3,4-dioxygenase beta subunit